MRVRNTTFFRERRHPATTILVLIEVARKRLIVFVVVVIIGISSSSSASYHRHIIIVIVISTTQSSPYHARVSTTSEAGPNPSLTMKIKLRFPGLGPGMQCHVVSHNVWFTESSSVAPRRRTTMTWPRPRPATRGQRGAVEKASADHAEDRHEPTHAR